MSGRIPANATPEVTEAFRQIDNVLIKFETANIALNGRRIIDAGDAVSPQDYVNLRQVKKLLESLRQELLDKIPAVQTTPPAA